MRQPRHRRMNQLGSPRPRSTPPVQVSARGRAYNPGVTPQPRRPDTETRLSPTARVEAFSDGVMAIAITLLVLDLKVPAQADADRLGLLGALAERWPSYLAYLAAFLTIGIIWLNHRT